MDSFTTILIMIIGLGVMVAVHELGHFIAGKIFKVKITEFGIGFGPKIFKKKGKETLFTLRAIPMGGFVRFLDADEVKPEEREELDKNDPRLLENTKIWKRLIIYAAGAFMNIILGLVLIFCIYFFIGVPTNTPVVGTVDKNMPAYEGGLLAGDIFTEVNGEAITHDNYNDAIQQIKNHINGEEIKITVLRNGEAVDLFITPKLVENNDGTSSYLLGFTFGYEYERLPFFKSIGLSFSVGGEMLTVIADAFKNLIFKGEGAGEVTGIVGMYGIMSDAAKQGLVSVLSVFSALTLNLAVVNLFPFPALDGGKIILLGVEAIRRKPIPKEKEGWLNLIGFGILILLMILVTIKDIAGLWS
ncbi:MAG: PDZ domain-containing protein [Clostridiales bacterium]|nr:PDZ domain-containing protein [Clostridiales bacterium]